MKPLRQGRLEGGFKGRYRSIPVNMRFFPGENSPIDTGAGGWAKYRETIPALYANYVFESQRVELEGGLRVEGVNVAYDVNPDHNTYKSDGYRYFQPFPNVRAAWKFDDANKLSLFVNRRVDRPNEVDIRIFPKYDEPELIKVGNPALQPQYATSAELGLQDQLVDGEPLRRRVSPHRRRDHHPHRHAGTRERAPVQRLPECRAELEHRGRGRLAAVGHARPSSSTPMPTSIAGPSTPSRSSTSIPSR